MTPGGVVGVIQCHVPSFHWRTMPRRDIRAARRPLPTAHPPGGRRALRLWLRITVLHGMCVRGQCVERIFTHTMW